MVEAWETVEPGAYCTITAPAGVVSIWAQGDERHRVVAEGTISEARVLVGHDAAHAFAHELARRMGVRQSG